MYYSVDKNQTSAGDNSATKNVRDGEFYYLCVLYYYYRHLSFDDIVHFGTEGIPNVVVCVRVIYIYIYI